MTSIYYTPASASYSGIKKVEYTTLTTEEWRRRACLVVSQEITGTSVKNTVLDARFGVIPPLTCLCPVCNYTATTCSGHWGYIQLVEPVRNEQYTQYIINILKSVCFECGHLRDILLESVTSSSVLSIPSSPHLRTTRLLSQVPPTTSMSKGRCSHCKAEYPDIIKKNITPSGQTTKRVRVFFLKTQSGGETMLTNRDILMCLKRCQPEVYQFFRLPPPSENARCNFANFMWEIIPVPPLRCRMWAIMRDGTRQDSDTTRTYNRIVSLNNQLFKAFAQMQTRVSTAGIPSSQTFTGRAMDIMNSLQLAVTELYTNKNFIPGDVRAGQASMLVNGLKQQFAGKHGLAQGHQASSRVNQSARCVIVGAGNIVPAGWLGVPYEIANTLTVPHYVTPSNYGHLSSLLDQKRVLYVHRHGAEIDVAMTTRQFTTPFCVGGVVGLQYGDIVDRVLRDGDVGIFNRQPSLRLESLRAFRLKILPPGYHAFMLCLCHTRGFNADFDGDEMNLHIPQTPGAMIECLMHLSVAHHIVSPQHHASVDGCVQNTLISLFLLTHDDAQIEIPREVWLDCAMAITSITRRDIWSEINRLAEVYPEHASHLRNKSSDSCVANVGFGKMLVSLIFPVEFSTQFESSHIPSRKHVVITKGIVMPHSAPISKRLIGPGLKSIVGWIWKYLSPTKALEFMTAAQALNHSIVTLLGFSVGLSDCIPTNPSQVTDVLNKTFNEAAQATREALTPDEIETRVSTILNGAMNYAPELARTNLPGGTTNPFVVMKHAGAKGSDANNGQISAFLGQQVIHGSRVVATLCGGKRSAPTFAKGDTSPLARGFIRGNFTLGLNPNEMTFHAAAGRVGVAATAVQTAESGYIQKNISHKLMNLRVRDDGMVVNAMNQVVVWFYGGDGFSAKYLAALPRKYPAPVTFFVDVEEMIMARGIESQYLTRTAVEYAISKLSFGSSSIITQYETEKVRMITKELLMKVVANGGGDAVKTIDELSPKEKQVAIEIASSISFHFQQSRAPNGLMAGLIASCSIGEPSTQMSVVRDTTIDVYDLVHNLIRTVKIGAWVDYYIDLVAHVPPSSHVSIECDISAFELSTMAITESGECVISLISHVSRHPCNGGLVEIMTESGNSVKGTLSHSFLTRSDDGGADRVVPICGKDVRVGMVMPCIRDSEVVWEVVVEVIAYDPHPDMLVYDLTVPGAQTFLANSFMFVHNTLNTFHSAGMAGKDVSVGLPRLKELLYASKNPAVSSTTIAWRVPPRRSDYIVSDRFIGEFARAHRCVLETTVKSVLQSTSYVTHPAHVPAWCELFAQHNVRPPPLFAKECGVLVFLDVPRIAISALPLHDIASKIERVAHTRFVDDAIKANVITNLHHHQTAHQKKTRKRDRDETQQHENSNTLGGTSSSSNPPPIVWCEWSPYGLGQILVWCDMSRVQCDRNAFLRDWIVGDLIPSVHLSGIYGVRRVSVRNMPSIPVNDGWVCETNPSCLKEALGLEECEPQYTTSDNMHEQLECFGIEYTKDCLMDEMARVLFFDSAYAEQRHIHVLVSAMTRTGVVLPAARTGILRSEEGPMSKGLYEQGLEHLSQAAAYQEEDTLTSLAGSVVMGTVAVSGSGSTRIV